MNHFIRPDWPAPSNVQAAATTRQGGISQGRFASFNLGFHTQDDALAVCHNRQQLYAQLQLNQEPAWLKQVHGNSVVDAANVTEPVTADASICCQPGKACVVMTADCLPVLLCDQAGRCVAAVHAGWRGLAAEIIGATVAAMPCQTEDLMVWLGPAIGPEAFEVGNEVRAEFLQLDDEGNQACFKPSPSGRWLADIYELARRELRALGITAIYGGGWCTVSDPARFYSYRRDGSSGRMASLIWLSEQAPNKSA